MPGQIALAPGPVSKSFVQPSGGYGWIGPAIASEREATAMDFIADYLFRSESGFVSKSVAEVNPDSVLVGQFITLHDPGVMFVAYSEKKRAPLKRSSTRASARYRSRSRRPILSRRSQRFNIIC